MSNYAQIITSFERAGNFPLEANYIFPTVEDLQEFYSDEVQAALIHKGLFKIVESDENNKQALYWVTPKQTNDELEFTKLLSGDDIKSITTDLSNLITQLETEIAERKNADTAIWGTEDPSNIDPDYNSINDLANQLKSLKAALDDLISGEGSTKEQLKAVVGTTEDDVAGYMQTLPYTSITEIAEALSNLLGTPAPSTEFSTLRGIEEYITKHIVIETTYHQQYLEELNNIETGVGLNADGSYSADIETYYLQDATSVMNALKTLDHLIHDLDTGTTIDVNNTDSAITLTLTEGVNSYILAAALKLSTEAGNQLVKKTDGLYVYARTEYEDGVLTFKVNDNIISQHNLGVTAILKNGYYDADTEDLVLIFNLQSGDDETVRIPVGDLIREWEPYNKENSPIVLERTINVEGTDLLSADINISTLEYNTLRKEGNTLYAAGSTDYLYHEGVLLSEYINAMVQKEAEDIADLKEKITNPTEYTIAKQETPEEDCFVTYILMKDDVPVGEKINIPNENALLTWEELD